MINEDKLEKIRIRLFIFYSLFALVSGILSLIGHEPRYIGDGLAFISAAVGGAVILFGSVQSLLKKNLTVDFLASIAIVVSIAIGQYLAAAVVVVMLNGGEVVEDYTARKASQALEKLIHSAPMKARVRRRGKEIEIPVEEVQVDDLVLVKPGEKIPLDGIVTKGYGSVNQASITGESMVIETTSRSEVYGNTLLEDGALEIRVTKEQKDTVFYHIIRLVEEAQTNKAPIERVADRYARWFAPGIIVLALATWFLTGNVLSTAAVLVVSCPCALTLATPIALVASTGNAARNGILVRDGTSLEEVGKSDIIIVDKTGTLTKGTPKVVEVKGFNERSEKEVIHLAAVAEKFSEHPIAKAILEKAEAFGLRVDDPDDFEVRRGHGVIAKTKGKGIVVGNKQLQEENHVVLTERIITYLDSQEINGRTTVLVSVDSELTGVISVSDTLRDDVATSIKEMRQNGVKKVVMLTGDNSFVAKKISKEASIDETWAELLPEEKVKHVKKYQSRGYKVTMIGDGVNDAPALATADIGIAMGIAGTDVAIETAGIVLTTDDLTKVSKIIQLSRSTLTIIKQNILFSLTVNILGLLLSTLGVITPIMASIVHESSALIVVFNSLRLATNKM